MDSKVLAEMGIDTGDADELDAFMDDLENTERQHNFVEQTGRKNGLSSDQIKECLLYVQMYKGTQQFDSDVNSIPEMNNRITSTDQWKEFPNIRAELQLQSRPDLQQMQDSFSTLGLLPPAYRTVQEILDFVDSPKNKLLDVKRF